MEPILFNTEMVRAILEGRKTVTRRPVKPRPLAEVKVLYRKDGTNIWRTNGADWWYEFRAPFTPGDILWVRETWAEMPYGFVYRADGGEPEGWDPDDRWRPSIHMPREAARLLLRVTEVRAERLQKITAEGALAEGIPDEWPMAPVYCPYCKGEGLVGALHPVSLGYIEVECPKCEKATSRFASLWDSTVKPADRPIYGWDANPWVWVIEFERCERPEEFA